MLGSLARKLRIFGFDTAYFSAGSDRGLEALAKAERRVILTSDRALYDHATSRGIEAALVTGRTDRERLGCVARVVGAASVKERRESRCAVCNGALERGGRTDARGWGVPPKVIQRHRQFYRCTNCSRLFWKGRHWTRLWRLSRSLVPKALT